MAPKNTRPGATLRAALPFSVILFAGLLSSQVAPREQVGPVAGGGFLLNSGWRLKPVGRHVPLDTFPISCTVSRDGKYVLALNAGYNPPSIGVVDIAREKETARVPVPDGWLGLAFSASGDRLYVGGGSKASVFEFSFVDGKLAPLRTFVIVPEGERKPADFVGDVVLSPDGKKIFAAIVHRGAIARIDVESGRLEQRFESASRPYRLRFSPGGKSLFASGWADATVYRHDPSNGAILGRIEVGEHPTDMLFAGSRLFVAAANTNQVFVIGPDMRVAERISVALTPRQPVGMTPSALALSADGKHLFIGCSDANALAVADISGKESRVEGFIPTAWYPTAVERLPDGGLAVLSARGLRSLPNPGGPNPGANVAPAHQGDPEAEYIARLHKGTLSFVKFDPAALEAQTRTVMANCPYRDSKLDNPGVKLPPVRHVFYIIKENRTYDQVLGDMPQGLGDPSLTLFGEKVTPNQHKIAREFVLFDNFYVNAEVSADGHNWSTAAIAPDYVQKMWGTSYGQRRRSHDYYGPGDIAAHAPGGYIWNKAAAAGLSMRNFGYHVESPRKAGPGGVEVEEVGDPVLKPVTNQYFRGFDLAYPEIDRAQAFLREFAEVEKKGEPARLTFIYLGRNHTAGTAPGRVTPASMVADNDYAVGLIVEAISKSRFWKDSAIFIVEDDAQNGPDHIDSHRSTAFVVSPYTKRRFVDSTMYNTTSMLRTMELLLGLTPMTQFDAGARPMGNAFQMKADLRQFAAERPRIPLDAKNPASGPMAAASARQNLSEPDDIDENVMNAALWLSIRGTDPPAAVRSFFGR